MQRLGQPGDADEIFRDLVQTANEALEKAPARIDFFSSFGDQQSQRSRLALAHFVAGLGHLGLGLRDKARLEMTQALAISPDHLGARTALAELR